MTIVILGLVLGFQVGVETPKSLKLGTNFEGESPRVKRIVTRDDSRREKHVGRGKSSSQDKGEGALDKAKGKAKEAIGVSGMMGNGTTVPGPTERNRSLLD